MKEPVLPNHDASASRRKTLVLAVTLGVVAVTLLAWWVGGAKDEAPRQADPGEDVAFASTDLVDASRRPGEGVLEEEHWDETTMDGEYAGAIGTAKASGKNSPTAPPRTSPSGADRPPADAKHATTPSNSGASPPRTAGGPPANSRKTADSPPVAIASKRKPTAAPSSKPAKDGREETPPSPVKADGASQIALISPKSRQTGVVQQTRDLISAEDFAEIIAMPVPAAIPLATPIGVPIADTIADDPPAPPAQAASDAPDTGRRPTPIPPVVRRKQPAKVTQEQARRFADILTKAWQQQGRIGKGQKIRLPSSSETANANVWRDDDPAAESSVRKPFALVVSEDGSPAPGKRAD